MTWTNKSALRRGVYSNAGNHELERLGWTGVNQNTKPRMRTSPNIIRYNGLRGYSVAPLKNPLCIVSWWAKITQNLKVYQGDIFGTITVSMHSCRIIRIQWRSTGYFQLWHSKIADVGLR